MKKLAALCVYFLMIMGCMVHAHTGRSWYTDHGEQSKHEFVNDIMSKSIAMVKPIIDDEGIPIGYGAYCGGVWITRQTFITAMHCAQHGSETPLESMLRALSDYNPDVSTYIGRSVEFTSHRLTAEETEGGLITSLPVMVGTIIAGDYDTDLALIVVESDAGAHNIARIKDVDADISDRLFVIGHPAGKLFSYSEIYVAGIRRARTVSGKKPVRLLEVKGPIWFGNSGGGAFDGHGDIAGICSFKHGKSSDISYFIHHTTIETFIAAHRTNIRH